MKRIFKYISIVLVGLYCISGNAFADDNDGIILSKNITRVSEGEYKIRLETSVAGTSVTTTTTEQKPVDLVLVLDISNSMNTTVSGTGTISPRASQKYSYNGFGTNTYYISYEGALYPVKRLDNSTTVYYLYYTANGTTYYLSGTGTTTTMPTDVTGVKSTIWTGTLYKGDTHTKESKAYNYNDFPKDNAQNKNKLYYLSNGNYYRVFRGSQTNHTYTLSFVDADNNTHYLSGSSIVDVEPTNVTSNTDTIWEGVLYENSGDKTRLQLLKEAVSAFIGQIGENSKGTNKEWGGGDDISNRIAIVTYADKGYPFLDFTDINSDEVVTNLQTKVNGITKISGTNADLGLAIAVEDMAGISEERLAKSSKVVVMFTDGEPSIYNRVRPAGDTVTNDNIRDVCVDYCHTLKQTYGAKVYSIAVGNDFTEGSNNYKYMDFMSSNWPEAVGMNAAENGSKFVGTFSFFQKSDGSDLTKIFTDIAESSSTEGEVVKLDATSTAVVDIVSNNFVIPGDAKNPAAINIFVESLWSEKKDGEWVMHWVGSDDDHYYYKGEVPKTTPDYETNSITVTGFNYSEDDEHDKTTGELTHQGNWVGPRYDGEKKPENIIGYWGNRLVIEFTVNLNPDYEGGYDMPSNDIKSGIYVDGKQVKPYPVPSVDFPSICIMKDGLEVGESAIFEVLGPTVDGKQVKYNVVLTQRADAYGDKLPCYVILKRLDGGTYKVTEKNWTWMYTTTPTCKYIEQTVVSAEYLGITVDDIFNGKEELSNNDTVVGMQKAVEGKGTFCVLKDKDGEYKVDDLKGSAISLLYHFTNERVQSSKPARAEAYAHNQFKGGTATTGGTEAGGYEEDEP